jgi:hypothetical protein
MPCDETEADEAQNDSSQIACGQVLTEENESDDDQQQRAGGVAESGENAEVPSRAIGEEHGELDGDDGDADGGAGQFRPLQVQGPEVREG